jgi:hypothetical protein
MYWSDASFRVLILLGCAISLGVKDYKQYDDVETITVKVVL